MKKLVEVLTGFRLVENNTNVMIKFEEEKLLLPPEQEELATYNGGGLV